MPAFPSGTPSLTMCKIRHDVVRFDDVSALCKRSDDQKIAEFFHANPSPAGVHMTEANYNVASTTHQSVIRQSRETGEREQSLHQ